MGQIAPVNMTKVNTSAWANMPKNSDSTTYNPISERQLVKVVKFATNITARMRQQEALAGQAVIEFDADGKVVQANDLFCT